MKALLPHLLGLEVTGTLTLPPDDNVPQKRKVVFQGCRPEAASYFTKSGKPMQTRAYINTPQASTSGAISRRGAMRDAMSAWHSATTEQRETARATALRRGLTLYNAYISDYLLAHKPASFTIWDYGATTWDNLKTLWEKIGAAGWDTGATIWDYGATTWDNFTSIKWDAGATIWDSGNTAWDVS